MPTQINTRGGRTEVKLGQTTSAGELTTNYVLLALQKPQSGRKFTKQLGLAITLP